MTEHQPKHAARYQPKHEGPPHRGGLLVSGVVAFVAVSGTFAATSQDTAPHRPVTSAALPADTSRLLGQPPVADLFTAPTPTSTPSQARARPRKSSPSAPSPSITLQQVNPGTATPSASPSVRLPNLDRLRVIRDKPVSTPSPAVSVPTNVPSSTTSPPAPSSTPTGTPTIVSGPAPSTTPPRRVPTPPPTTEPVPTPTSTPSPTVTWTPPEPTVTWTPTPDPTCTRHHRRHHHCDSD